jgi:hypothetical protein
MLTGLIIATFTITIVVYTILQTFRLVVIRDVRYEKKIVFVSTIFYLVLWGIDGFSLDGLTLWTGTMLGYTSAIAVMALYNAQIDDSVG